MEFSKESQQIITVVVGVPTYKRPNGLKKLLKSLDSLFLTNQVELKVLVADNDCINTQGVNLVNGIRTELSYEIETIIVEERGISFVRNQILSHAFEKNQADFLAMVDDDEWVDANWLQSLLDVQKNTSCEIVGGIVRPDFATPPPKWLEELSIYYPPEPSYSQQVDLLEGVGNVLLCKNVYFQFEQQRFDPFYALFGGGDKEYFTRLKERGARFAIAVSAVSHEVFDDGRMTKQWAIERAYRIGAADMRIILKHHGNFKTLLLELTKIPLALSLGFVLCLAFHNQAKQMKGRLLMYRQLGKVSGLFNKHKAVYKKVHGS